MVYCGGKYYESFEELGNSILADLPKERLPVKWWRIHKPARSYHTNCLRTNWLGRILRTLPHLHWSRSYVGYLHVHLYLFNKYAFLFTLGHWEGPQE